MSQNSKIEWTDHTFNPWWGCTKISPGCAHCYADTYSTFRGHKVWGEDAGRRMFGNSHWSEPVKWNRAAEEAGKVIDVFCASMCDIMEDRRDLDAPRGRLWPLIESTPWLRWLLLSKRPENYRRLVPGTWLHAPPRNVMIGCTTEDQMRYDQRMPCIVEASHAGFETFLSMEPLLGPIDVTPPQHRGTNFNGNDWLQCVNWIIVGGESGPGARPMHPDWAREIRDRCDQRTDMGRPWPLPFFFKQWGNWIPGTNGTHFVCEAGHYDLCNIDRLSKHTDGDSCLSNLVSINRVDKKAAGRRLDGREHNDKPAALQPATAEVP